MRNFLALETGQIFEGRKKGGNEPTLGVGEVVFNTGMVGYQEILTDPSYYQQIIVMTSSEQGNYGVHVDERESAKIWAQGFICLEMNEGRPSGRQSLDQELKAFGVPALAGVDTRALTLFLRTHGTVWGAIVEAENEIRAKELALVRITERKKALDSDWVYHASTKDSYVVSGNSSKRSRVAVLDFGAKTNILRNLSQRCREVKVFSSRASVREILDWNPHGIMLTNGPGDPALVQVAVGTVKELLGQKPLFGICMGNQILALALGAKTYKLKFGHRGINHPVQDYLTKEIYMTSQNHGYCVDEKTLPSDARMSQINLYDKTCEGIEAVRLKAWSVQYHPEAAPGPNDATKLFDRFVDGLNLT